MTPQWAILIGRLLGHKPAKPDATALRKAVADARVNKDRVALERAQRALRSAVHEERQMLRSSRPVLRVVK
jgi:hypothetical protein